MSRDFEVIYEAPLRTEDYGEGKGSSTVSTIPDSSADNLCPLQTR
jgi:hypothetical protein